MLLTIKIKLLTSQEQKELLLQMMEKFNEACNHISEVAFKEKVFGQISLQKITYYEIRKQFNLPSQLAVRAIGKVSESYKVQKHTQIQFCKRSAVVLDRRLYSPFGMDRISIITLNQGRIIVPMIVGRYFKMQNRRVRGQADLIYIDGVFYLCMVVEFPDGELIKTDGFLGVDMGIVNIATTSTGNKFSGSTVDKVRIRISNHRNRLQKCGTRSARKRLKKISRQQRRFVRNINHCVSKDVVKEAKALNLGVAVEDLHKIKKTVRKSQRQRHEQWSFYELATFLEYKCKLAGLPFVKVDPSYTSQRCSQCGHISRFNRKTQAKFVCEHCGFSMNADINAAINIAARASVNMPIVTSLVA